jgi:hypothetical protein
METPFWVEKTWGDHVENATMDDVRVAIKETLDMDDEHGEFWVGRVGFPKLRPGRVRVEHLTLNFTT